MKYESVDIYQGFQTKGQNHLKTLFTSDDHDDDDDHKYYLIIKLSNSWLLKLMSRVMILAIFILSCPWLNMVIGHIAMAANMVDSMDVEMLPFLFHDLSNEGLLKMNGKSVFISNRNDDQTIYDSQSIKDYHMDVIQNSEFEQHSSSSRLIIPDETFDFVFVSACNYDYASKRFVDRSLKIGGVVVIQVSDDSMVASFEKPSNYEIVYVKKFDSKTIMGLRKIRHGDDYYSSVGHRKLLGISADEAKKAALENLEDVLLEPPRAASGKSRKYLKHTRYLPDLMGDSLESYPRRVFIDVSFHDKNNKIAPSDHDHSWFVKHYPTRNKDFEIYKVNTIIAEPSPDRKEIPQASMSDWLQTNVKDNEYVVMKAEAGVVEDLVKTKAIKLVDELFLECRHRGVKKGPNKGKRAYWECLALYGVLRDEGVAVHQWWG